VTTPGGGTIQLSTITIILIALVVVGGIAIAGYVVYKQWKNKQVKTGVPMEELESELKLLGEEIANERMVNPGQESNSSFNKRNPLNVSHEEEEDAES